MAVLIFLAAIVGIAIIGVIIAVIAAVSGTVAAVTDEEEES